MPEYSENSMFKKNRQDTLDELKQSQARLTEILLLLKTCCCIPESPPEHKSK